MAAARKAAAAVAAGLLALAAAMPAQAQEEEGTAVTAPSTDRPALLQAEEIVHDRVADVVTARGRVEVSQDGRVLLADRLTYRLREGEIVASGHVALVEPTGEVFFADEITLSDDMRRGVASRIGVLLEDNARIAAARGERLGDVTRLDRAVYSPCDVCADDERPLWRIKALEVVHDRERHNIYYHNAWLEVLGIPVAYTPWFSHPDPTIERRSGVLAPAFGRGTDLGSSVQVPYYHVLSPQEDVTLTPMATSREGLVMIGEHRRRFGNGLTVSQGSITRDSDDDVRWHIDAEGEFHLDDVWFAGYEAERASDDTYLRRYGFHSDRSWVGGQGAGAVGQGPVGFHGDRSWLTTHPYLVGLTRRSYVSVEGFALQSLRQEIDNDTLPLVLPWAQYSHVTERDRLGGRWLIDASALALTRIEGTDTQRLSARVGWERPMALASGQLLTPTLSLRGDGYRLNDLTGPQDSDVTGRIVPEAALEWRYPFVSSAGGLQHVVEPIVLAAATLSDVNPGAIPNEDSLDLALDASNLFSVDRFTGLDRVEEGTRINYGLSYSLGGKDFHASALVGQVYRFEESTLYPQGSGLEDRFSDVVGQFTAGIGRHLDLNYRVRLDNDDMSMRFSDLGAGISVDPVRFNLDYIYVDEMRQGGLEERQELYAEASVAVSPRWTVTAFSRYDLDNGSPLVTGAALGYEDECFAILATWENNRTQDRDFSAGQSFGVRFVFKTLGAVGL